jgi:predicted nucleic acid-binding protein
LQVVLTQKKRVAIPVSTVIGAYHVCTRYLGVPRVAVKRVLEDILSSGSPALYQSVGADSAREVLDYAASYGIESWDGYLISLTKKLGSSIVYTLDNDMKRVKEVSVVNPFTDEGFGLIIDSLNRSSRRVVLDRDRERTLK